MTSLLLAAALYVQAPAPSAQKVLEGLEAVRTFESVSISPDGRHVAWVEELGSERSEIWIAAKDGSGPARKLSAATAKAPARRERSPVFSPDGRRVAFLSDAERERQLQLYVADAAGGKPEKVTSFTGHVADPAFSPDGRSLACLVIENATRGA